MKDKLYKLRWAALLGAFTVFATSGYAQDTDDDDVFELSPFTVDASEDTGYIATSTLAGTRLRSDLKDLGSAISVVTKEFMDDIGAVDNETLLSYTTGTEVGGTYSSYTGAGDGASLNERGSFNSPNQNTRVRGLTSADNTVNFFRTDVPWDGYNVDRVDMQRGPNSMLFGLGSPAGIINANTQEAQFNDFNKIEFRFGSFGSLRGTFNFNRELIDDVLAVRVAAASDHRDFKQDPAHDNKDRFYVAGKFVPEFLNGDRTNFIIKANWENGQVRSNRPRVLPPQDYITPFFNPPSYASNGVFPLERGIGGETFDPFIVRRRAQDGLGGGQMQQEIEIDGVAQQNPFYNPAIGNYAQLFGGPLFMFDTVYADSPSRVVVTEINQRGGLAPDGSIDDNLATGFGRLTAPVNYVTYSQDANLPFSTFGQYKQPLLQDRSIFDFYNKLIDGPNKKEWSDWDVYNVAIENTFFKNTLGYELSYFKQEYDEGRVGITGFNDAIYVDTNSHMTDGTPNPNAGRPFISDSMEGGNQIRSMDKEAYRGSAFYRLKLEDIADNWLTRLLGTHTFNAAHSEEKFLNDTRQFLRFRMEDAYYDMTKVVDGKDNINLINTSHYLGGSLLGASTASGANLSNLQAVQLPESAPVYFFDTTWNSTVDPGAEWITDTGGTSTQSENPANYVGWTTRQFNVLDSLVDDNYNRMINRADLAKTEIESDALVWQGFLWNRSIVGTYGWREDTVKTWQSAAPEFREAAGGMQRLKDVDPSVYNVDFAPNVEVGQSRSWSVGVHVDRLPFGRWLPIEVSLYYNEGENFQPGAGRVDLFGHEISAPFGDTVDKSILLATKDGKYSLRITDYETTVNNSSSSYIQGSWFIGRFIAWGENWANIFDYNISNGYTLDGVAQPGDTRRWRYEMKNPQGQIDPQYEAEAIAGWRAFVNEVVTDYSDYVTAWKLDGLGTEVKNFNSQDPAGLSYVQNTVSEGKEFEFLAQPTPNWRIAINASQTKAQRNDVGGAALIEWVELVDRNLADKPGGDAGDIRIWSGGGNTIRNMWNSTFRSNYALTELLEGTSTPEVREWRFNLITNYRFTEGRFKNWSVGGAMRWEDDVIIGYPVGTNSEGVTSFDLSNPYHGPANTKIDLSLSYQHKFNNGVRWRVQLNARNVFGDDDLIPITIQADGSVAAARIPEAKTWSITNTIEF